jgi:hypothetical protein
MTHPTSDELETELRTLFDRQQRSIQPTGREWTDVSVRKLIDSRPAQSSRRRVAIAATVLVASAAMIAIVAAVAGHGTTRRTGAASHVNENPVHWSTPQVRLDATDFSITVGGKRFIAGDRHGAFPTGDGIRHVLVRSDPGDAKYQTLELTWQEHGVEMRWYIYFASDGKDWWATEMRTYNGRRNGDWVEFPAWPDQRKPPPTFNYFRRPLGTAFTGDIELNGLDPQTRITSHLSVTGLRLQAFRNDGTAPRSTAPGS